MKASAVRLAVLCGASGLLLSGCTVVKLTSTSPTAAHASVCAELFGDPLNLSSLLPGNELPLLSVVGDPYYELHCTYGEHESEEFIVAVTTLDASDARESAKRELADRGLTPVLDGEDSTYISAGRYGAIAGEAHLIDATSWVRVTVVSPEESTQTRDHARIVDVISLWLVEIRQRAHNR